jgi:hypothetical protein
MKFLLPVIFCLFQLSAFAGMTLITRETFQGVGVVNTTNVENLRQVTGNFYKRAVGPRLTNDFSAGGLGWSADAEGQGSVYQTYYPTNCAALPVGTYNSPTNAFVFDWWIWANNIIQPEPSGAYYVLFNMNMAYDAATVEITNTGLCQPFLCTSSDEAFSALTTNFMFLPNTWINLRVAYEKTLNNYYGYDVTVLGRISGTTNFTILLAVTNTTLYNDPQSAQIGFHNIGGGGSWRGRFGLLSVWQLDSWADRFDLIPDQADPPNPPFQWYLNGTGNDTNDGTSALSAWKSVTKLNTELANCGVFPSMTVLPGGGDRVTVDNTIPLDLGSNSLIITSDGVKVEFTNGPVIAYSTLSPTNWVKTPGWTNIWQTTDKGSADMTSVVVWEDDRWLSHRVGATFADVAGYMDTNPGSFYCDSTNLFVHAFESGSPTNDGHIYTRSRNRGGGGSSALDIIGARNVWIDGFSVSKTCLCQSTDNDPVAAGGWQFNHNDGGTNIVSNFIVSYWGKHGGGRTSDGIAMDVIRTNGFYGPGSPYTGFGGQTADVDYCLIGTNNRYEYYNVSCPQNSGLIGGYGRADPAQEFWFSHAGGRVFDGGIFKNINVCSQLIEEADTVNEIFVTNSTFAGAYFVCNFDIENCLVVGQPVAEQWTLGTGIVRNCILQINYPNTGLGYAPLCGTQIVENCDFDMTGWTNADLRGIWIRGGQTKMTFLNNIFDTGSASAWAILNGFDTNDVFIFSNNVYAFGLTNVVAIFTNGPNGRVNFALWQSLGFDANSVAVTNLLLNSNYLPETGSAAIGNGLNLSAFFNTDYAGNPRPTTDAWTIGAYQVVSNTGGAGKMTMVFLPAATGSGGMLKLAWPADYLGWILQAQTNRLDTGLSTNWVDVPGSSAITQTNISVDSAKPLMFFRLRSP